MAEILDIQRPGPAQRLSRKCAESSEPIRPSRDYLVILGKRSEQADRILKQNAETRQQARLPKGDLVMLNERSQQPDRASRKQVESGQPTSPSEDYLDILRQLSEQTHSRRVWQIVAIGLILVAMVGAAATARQYLERRFTMSMLVSSREFTTVLAKDLNAANQSVESLKRDLVRAAAAATAGQSGSQTLNGSLDDARLAERERNDALQRQIAGL